MASFTSYQKRLFIFLSVATFFEGYDIMAMSQLLPQLRADFGLDELGVGYMLAFVNIGTVAAYLLVRRADRWGRRRLLMVTIVGYTLFTFLSGLAPDVYWFSLAQFVGRIFLIAEWVTSMVYASEEFPAEKRGLVIGLLQGFSSLGSVVCAGTVPLILKLPGVLGMEQVEGWRFVYFVAVVPLVLLAYARRNLKETKRFEEQVLARESQGAGSGSAVTADLKRSIFVVLKGPYRTRIFKLGLIWFLTYACTQTAVSLWKDFVVTERGFSDGQVGLSITLAALVSMPLVFAAGKLLDVVGRRRGAVIIYSVTAVSVFGAYGLHGQWPLTIALLGAIFGVSAVLPVLNAYNNELFPTEIRGDAYAWTNNLLGRISYVIAPIFVGFFARDVGWGAAMRPTVIFPLVALALILLWLPETRNKELEETARL